MRIRAALARAGQPFTIEDCELDSPSSNEVLVRVEACGICHTDLSAKDHGYGTPLPAVLGHEGVGRIEAIGEGCVGLEIGQRVVMSFGACGRCSSCSEGMPAYCRHALDFNLLGRRLDGSSPIRCADQPITGHFFGQSTFASHALACATNLVPVPEDLPIAAMAPLACGVQTGMGAVINVLRAGPADSIGIFGCGTVGLAALMAAKIAGCSRIVAVDLREDRLALARRLGATDLIDSSRESLADALARLHGLTLGFDNTGKPEVIEAAFAALRPRGQLALAGVGPRGSSVRIDTNRMMATGRALRGTVEGDADPRSFIPRMIAWYRSKALPLDELVVTYPFDRINEAAADMQSGRVVKPVLLMPEREVSPT